MPTLVVLLPPRTRRTGEWLVVDLPCYYEDAGNCSKERSQGEADSEEKHEKPRDKQHSHR